MFLSHVRSTMKHKVKLFNNGSDISPSEKFRYHLFFVAFLCCALASFELLAFFISSEFHDNIIYTRTWCDVVRETKKPKHSVRCCWAREKLWTLWIFIKCMCLNDVLILTVQDVYEYASGVGLRRAAARHRQEIINMETTQRIFELHFKREGRLQRRLFIEICGKYLSLFTELSKSVMFSSSLEVSIMPKSNYLDQ